MKKLFCFVSLMLMFAFFTSCSNEDYSCLTEEKETEISHQENFNKFAFDELKKEFDELGDKARKDALANSMLTRGSGGSIFKFFKRIVNTIKADCVIGMIIADLTDNNYMAAVGGIAGSAIYYTWAKRNDALLARALEPVPFTPTPRDTINRNEILNNLVFPTNGSNATFVDSVGYIHNAVILNMYEHNPHLFTREAFYQNEFLDSICSYTEKEIACRPYIVSTTDESFNDVRNTIYDFRDYIADIDSIDAYTDSICNNNETIANEWEIASSFIETLNDLENDQITQQQYTKQALLLVRSSELPEHIKTSLSIGLIIAHASEKLWSSEALP